MTQSQPVEIAPTKMERKTYFPFQYGLRSAEYQGVGACLAENAYIDDGRLRKMKGQDLWKDTSTPVGIVWMGDYRKSDNTHQTLYAYAIGNKYKIRAVEEDLSITVPTGGAGDVEFTSDLFDIAQIGATAYIINDSATTPGYTWNGTALTAISNMPVSPKFVVRDGNRIIVNKVFSGETPSDFTAGAGVLADGDLAISIEPTGAVVAGSGVIIFGTMGAEAHKVIPNNSSDNVSAQTKLEGFSYTGLGIQNTHQVCAGKNFVYFINEEGIHEMNPYNGATVNLADVGNIKRRWDKYTLSSSFIQYDPKNNFIVAVVKSIGQNDTMIIVDVEKKDKPITIAPSAFFSSIANINGVIRGGSSHDGKIINLFSTYTDRDSTALQFRYIIEWDALTNTMLEKRLKRFSIFANLNPQSSFTVRLYKDGYHEPIKTEVFTTTAATGTGKIGTTVGEWGKYIFSIGGGRDYASADLNSDKMKRVRKNTKCSTYTLEITEKSFYDFVINDILLEYKTKGRLIRNQTMPNTLF